MPNIQMPDGSVIQFPDSMSEDQINKALAGQVGPGRLPALLAGSALSGVASAVGVPGDLESLADRYIFGVDPTTDPHRLPTSAEVRAATTDKLGMSGPEALVRPDPSNPLEVWGSAAATGLGSGLLTGPLGTVAGIGGGLGAEAGHQALPESELAPLVGGVLGGGLTGGVESLVRGPELTRLANSLGESSTLQQAGTKLQSAARDWLGNTLPKRLSDIFHGVDPSDPAAVAEANAQAQDLMNFAKGPLAKVVKSKTPTPDDPNPEVVASRLLTGGRRGGSDLQALADEFPDEIGELASAHLRTNPAGWGKLSPEAQAALAGDAATAKAVGKAVPADSSSAGGSGFMDRIVHRVVHKATEGVPLAVFGGGVGHLFGQDPFLSALAGEGLGMALPWAGVGARSIVGNPLVQRGVFAGATVGRNPLLVP